MANVTTRSEVPAAVDTYYDKVLLARAKPYLIHSLFGLKKSIPAKSGSIAKFRRYTNLSTATTALTDGTTPAGSKLSVTDMTAQIDEYGDYITITDQVEYIVEDNVLNEATGILSRQMGETLDELVRDVLASTASTDQCTNGVNGSTPTELTYADIQGVVKTLMGNSARMFTPAIEGANKFGTAPVRRSFWALGDTDILDDLEAIDEFIPVAQYPQASGLNDAEWGSVGNTRWLLSPNGYVSSSTYSNFIVGEEAYGLIDLNAGTMKNIYKPLGQGDDPLNQRSTMGWRAYHVSRILNDSWLIDLNSTHS